MWQQFLDNKEWIFSGIGTAVLIAVVTHFASLARFVRLTGAKPLRFRRVYQSATVKAIHLASQRLYLCYSRLGASTTGDSHAKAFNKQLAEIANAGQLKPVVLLAQKPDRLQCAYELTKNHVDVRFSSDFKIFDLRYIIADAEMAVIGEKTTVGNNENYTVSTRWLQIQSSAIVQLLRNRFEDAISEPTTIPFDQYARFCAFMYRNERAALNMPAEFWTTFLHTRFSEDGHVPLVLVIGRPGSGKSTFARRMISHLSKHTPLRRCIHIPDYDYFRAQFEHVDTIDGIARRVGGGFLLDNPPAIFRDATESVIQRVKELKSSATAPDMIFAEIARNAYLDDIKAFSAANIPPDYVVYLDAPFTICSSRNRDRPKGVDGDTHMVSEEEMDRTYSHDDLDSLKTELSDRLLVLNNSINGQGHVDAAVKSFAQLALPRIIGT